MEPTISACIAILNTTTKLAERIIAVERLIAELRQITNELGELQLNDALNALDKARISNNPNRELGSAVNHLEDALSLFRQNYRRTDYSLRRKLTRTVNSRLSIDIAFEEPDNNPRYEAGKKICTVLAIMTTIYNTIGEQQVALRQAEELRDDADKAYPSTFYVKEGTTTWISALPLDPDHGLNFWGKSSECLEEAFSFFESVNVFLMRVGANPVNLQLRVHVRHFVTPAANLRESGYHYSPEFMVSSRRDLIMQYMQYREDLPRTFHLR